MAIIEFSRNPSRRDLLVFCGVLPILFGVLGALRWHAASPRTAVALWIAGAAIALLVIAVPPSRRLLYLGWMYAFYPIAWTVSHAILGAAYFLVATPLALMLRMLGRDPMCRKFDEAAKTYWVLREPKRDDARYFRQF